MSYQLKNNTLFPELILYLRNSLITLVTNGAITYELAQLISFTVPWLRKYTIGDECDMAKTSYFNVEYKISYLT